MGVGVQWSSHKCQPEQRWEPSIYLQAPVSPWGPVLYCQYSPTIATELSTCPRDLVIKPKISTVWFIRGKVYCIFAILKWLSQRKTNII